MFLGNRALGEAVHQPIKHVSHFGLQHPDSLFLDDFYHHCLQNSLGRTHGSTERSGEYMPDRRNSTLKVCTPDPQYKRVTGGCNKSVLARDNAPSVLGLVMTTRVFGDW